MASSSKSRLSACSLPALLALGSVASALIGSAAHARPPLSPALGGSTPPPPPPFLPALTNAEVNPAYLSADDESQQGLIPPASLKPGSFAFYFDTTEDKTANALGFFSVGDWITASGPASFDVILYKWSYDGMQTTFDPKAITTFQKSAASTYFTRNNYYWLPISPVMLSRSDQDMNTEGYVVTAIGDFSKVTGLPFFFGGNGYLDSGFLYTGNGLNIDSPPPPDPGNVYIDFPFPLQEGVDANGVPIYGYFSANVSYAVVPGPLPLMGAGVAYSWSRRLRRRITAKR